MSWKNHNKPPSQKSKIPVEQTEPTNISYTSNEQHASSHKALLLLLHLVAQTQLFHEEELDLIRSMNPKASLDTVEKHLKGKLFITLGVESSIVSKLESSLRQDTVGYYEKIISEIGQIRSDIEWLKKKRVKREYSTQTDLNKKNLVDKGQSTDELVSEVSNTSIENGDNISNSPVKIPIALVPQKSPRKQSIAVENENLDSIYSLEIDMQKNALDTGNQVANQLLSTAKRHSIQFSGARKASIVNQLQNDIRLKRIENNPLPKRNSIDTQLKRPLTFANEKTQYIPENPKSSFLFLDEDSMMHSLPELIYSEEQQSLKQSQILKSPKKMDTRNEIDQIIKILNK